MVDGLMVKRHEGLSNNKRNIYISSFGDVISSKYLKTKDRWSIPILLKTKLDQGYYKIRLKDDCKMVSRLVAEAWLDLPDDYDAEKYEVHHINEDKLDNSVTNLYVIKKENHKTLHSIKYIYKVENNKKKLEKRNLIEILGDDRGKLESILNEIKKNNKEKTTFEFEHEGICYGVVI